MKKIFLLAIIGVFILTIALSMLPVGQEKTVAAAEGIDVWGPGKNAIEDVGYAEKDPRQIVAGIIKIALGFLGTIAVVIILIGGFKWMTAGGNEENVAAAKQFIYAGIIGLVIILAAYAVANFAVTQLMEVARE